MQFTLYSTNCPRCKVLEAKLVQKKIEYKLVTDMDEMVKHGFHSAPMLEVDDVVYDFAAAAKFLNEVNVDGCDQCKIK